MSQFACCVFIRTYIHTYIHTTCLPAAVLTNAVFTSVFLFYVCGKYHVIFVAGLSHHLSRLRYFSFSDSAHFRLRSTERIL